MPFTKLPSQVAPIARTKHTELVAVFGAFKKGRRTFAAVAGDELVFSSVDGWVFEDAAAWTWGATKDKPRPRLSGSLFGVRGDGLAVTDADETFTTWRGGKKGKTVKHPNFGMSVAEGEIIHDRLVLTACKAGVVVVDLDTGKVARTIEPFVPKLPPDHENAYEDTCSHWIGEAPDGGIAVSDGDAVTIYDLATGKPRSGFEAPNGLEMRTPAVTPDGRYIVVQTVSKAKWTVGVTGFAVFDMTKKKWVKQITGNRPSYCGAAFVDGGKLLAVTLTKPAVDLYAVGTWKRVETIDFKRPNDAVTTVIPWDARGAMVVTGDKGAAYVFLVGSGAATRPAAARDANARDLYFVEGTSNKVWRARLEGSTYTTQWGRRGGAIMEKTFGLASVAAAKQAYDKAVAEKLRKGYKDSVG
jgi:predicted DNA-binding WGR domain protein